MVAFISSSLYPIFNHCSIEESCSLNFVFLSLFLPLFIFAPHLHIQCLRPRPLVKILSLFRRFFSKPVFSVCYALSVMISLPRISIPQRLHLLLTFSNSIKQFYSIFTHFVTSSPLLTFFRPYFPSLNPHLVLSLFSPTLLSEKTAKLVTKPFFSRQWLSFSLTPLSTHGFPYSAFSLLPHSLTFTPPV